MADNFKFVSAGVKTLSASITSTATTVTLTDLNSRDETALTMSDFGDIGFATLDPGGSNMELISFTGISSTSLTGVTRGLGFESPYTNVSALQKAHAAGTKVVFSNSPQFYNELAGKDNDESVTGTWTFSSSAMPTLDSYAAPTADEEFASKKYVDDVAAGGTASINRIVVDATAGETVAAGELVYFDTTDNEWKLTDANTASTVDNVLLGIAQGAGTDGNTITGGVLTRGLDSNQTGMTEGDVMYASDTAGAIASSAGTTEVTIGIARSATELYFEPRFNQNITEAQQDLIDAITANATEINQLDGATITASQLTEAGTFFGATDISGAEAETLTDGSDADSLHTHGSISVYDMNKAEQETATHVSFRLFDVDDSSDDIWSTTTNGTSSDIKYGLGKVEIDTGTASGDDAVLYTTRIVDTATGGVTDSPDFDQDFSLCMTVQTKTTTDQALHWGICESTGDALSLGTTGDATIAFHVEDGTLYTITGANGGGSYTSNDVSSGITLTDRNVYEIIWTAGSQAVFKINGTTVATHTTDLPSGSTGFTLGFGATTQTTAQRGLAIFGNAVMKVELP